MLPCICSSSGKCNANRIVEPNNTISNKPEGERGGSFLTCEAIRNCWEMHLKLTELR